VQTIFRAAFAGVLAVLCVILPGGAVAAALEETSAPVSAVVGENPPIRVLLVDSVTSVCITPRPAWQIRSLPGKVLRVLKEDVPTTVAVVDGEMRLISGGAVVHKGGVTDDGGGRIGTEPVVLESTAEGGVLGIRQVPYGVGWWWESAEDRKYEGRIEIRPGLNGKLEIVAELPLEEYLRGVVPSEIGGDSPLQALCAQAVAARSAAVLALTSPIYAGPHFDICSDVACQAFSGVTKSTTSTDEAIRATRGHVLMFEGKPVSAYYASNCGGHSEDIRNVWPDRASDRAYWDTGVFDGAGRCELDLTTDTDVRKWLDADPDVYCNPAKNKVPEWSKKNFRWTRQVSAEELTARVALKKDIGRVREVWSIRRGVSGRLIEAEFVGEKGSLRVSPELAIRQVLDPPLKSAVFVVDAVGVQDDPKQFVIRGAGWGHGVGMCQTGAIGMANRGNDFREILGHYYPNAKIEKLY
jgi:peptidoglycan hydrolase-like amidase